MTPEQEAKNLIDKYLKIIKESMDVFNAYADLTLAKTCALVVAKRCEEFVYSIPISEETFSYRKQHLEHWKQVIIILSKK